MSFGRRGKDEEHDAPAGEAPFILDLNQARRDLGLSEPSPELLEQWRLIQGGKPAILGDKVKVETLYDSRPETNEHIAQVRGLMLGVAGELVGRGHRHDASKLHEPEVATFDRVTARLRDLTYDSPEYKACLKDMGPALEHHYAVNDHHPEHFEDGLHHETDAHDYTNYLPGGEQTLCRAWCSACDWTDDGDPKDVHDAAWSHEVEETTFGGIAGMNILQLTEMLCDWIAATRRHKNGDIHDSIRKNRGRFGYDDEIERLLHNSVEALLEAEVTVPIPG